MVLTSPSDGSVGLLSPVELVWQSSERASSYKLQVAKDGNFTDLVVDEELTETTKTVSELEDLTQYYWRVRGINAGGEGDWSDMWTFKTLGSPTTVTLLSPENGVVDQPLEVSFVWSSAKDQMKMLVGEIRGKGDNEVKSISRYWFELSKSEGGASVVLDTNLIDTTKTISGLEYLTDYYWRVRAENETGWGEYSSWSKFTTIIEKPAQVVLTSPSNGSTGLLSPVELVWSSSERAESYKLQVAKDGNFTNILLDEELTETTKTVEGLEDLTQYYWRVRGINAGGEGDWSEMWNFTLGAPETPILIAPVNNSIIADTATSVTFIWSAVESADKYTLQASLTQSFDSLFISLEDQTDTTFTYNGQLLPSVFFWRVSASNDAGASEWSDFFTVTIVTSLDMFKFEIPKDFQLLQNYPNPFNPSTIIRFGIPFNSTVKLDVYDVLGRKVTSLFNGNLEAGYHEFNFNASNLSSGIYFYNIQANSNDNQNQFNSIKKMLLIK